MIKNKMLIIGLGILLWGMFNQFVMAQVYSDTTWERLYYSSNIDERSFSNNHLEMYDNGYLLATYFNTNDISKPKIIKTDIMV